MAILVTVTGVAAGFIRDIRVDTRQIHQGYPFSLPVVAWLARSRSLEFSPTVTFRPWPEGSGS